MGRGSGREAGREAEREAESYTRGEKRGEGQWEGSARAYLRHAQEEGRQHRDQFRPAAGGDLGSGGSSVVL